MKTLLAILFVIAVAAVFALVMNIVEGISDRRYWREKDRAIEFEKRKKEEER